MTSYIDQRRERFGVEPICEVLELNPSTYYARKVRAPSKRTLRDAWLASHIHPVWTQNHCVYGQRKVWKQLRREGVPVARCTVQRLMRTAGLQGIRRGKRWKTTIPDTSAPRPQDLVEPA